jgi:hypothetical protein
MTFDGKAFGVEIVGVVKDYVAGVVGPLVARIDELEKQIAAIPAPVDPDWSGYALKAELPDTSPLVAEIKELREAIAAIPAPLEGKPGEPGRDGIDGKDGTSVTIDDVMPIIREAIEAIPAPKDGVDGKDGSSVTIDDVAPLIEEAVAKAVSSIPVPKDGADGRDGKDGLSVKDFVRDKEGHLIVVMSDGTTKDLGEIDGKDGAQGEPGRDGTNGKDGKDGLGFDDMDLVETEKGTFLRFMRGDQVKEFRLPIVIDRGVFKEGETYQKGDGVTWGGSFWIAQDETADKPDTGKGWRLAVKKGRDGRDGKDNRPKEPVKVKV